MHKKIINHVMYIDEVKLFAKNEKELKTLTQTIRIYSQDIGMEFGREKYAMLIMRSGKRQITEVIEQPNQERINVCRKGNLHVSRNIISGHHQTNGDERKKQTNKQKRNKTTNKQKTKKNKKQKKKNENKRKIFDEQGNFSKLSSAARVSSKGLTSGQSSL